MPFSQILLDVVRFPEGFKFLFKNVESCAKNLDAHKIFNTEKYSHIHTYCFIFMIFQQGENQFLDIMTKKQR